MRKARVDSGEIRGSIIPPRHLALRPHVIRLPESLELHDELVDLAPVRARSSGGRTSGGRRRDVQRGLHERGRKRIGLVVLRCRCVPQAREKELRCEALRSRQGRGGRQKGEEGRLNLIDLSLLSLRVLPARLGVLGSVSARSRYRSSCTASVFLVVIIRSCCCHCNQGGNTY
jgi:hypothetical protein